MVSMSDFDSDDTGSSPVRAVKYSRSIMEMQGSSKA